VATAARSQSHRNWKATDVKLTDAINEAKDNVKYLVTLEKALEPMYIGAPAQVMESLPALVNGVKVRLLPIRPRSRCERRSLRTFPVVTLHPRFPFNV